jgi:hypothetical protein
MASSTRSSRTASRLLAAAAVLLLGACHGGGTIESARIDGGAAPVLDARLRLAPSPALLQALDRGVPLVLRLDLRARDGAGARDATHRILLRFLPLARQYAWTDLDTGAVRYFARQTLLLAALDRVRLPLDPSWADLAPGAHVTLSVALDVDALPAPLRLPALLSPRWRLNPPDFAWTAGN